MSIDAMKQALDALEEMKAEFRALDLPYGSKAYTKANNSTHALRAAIEQAQTGSAQNGLAEKIPAKGTLLEQTLKDVWDEMPHTALMDAIIGGTGVMLGDKRKRTMDKPFSSWVQWDNTVCNPLAPSREQTQSAWQHGYESGFVDGMSKQAQSSVDKAVNAMVDAARMQSEPVIRRSWQGLTDEEIWSDGSTMDLSEDGIRKFARAIEAKLREKNNG